MSDRELIEQALLDDLERQNPDMRQDPERDTVWLSGGATPQTCGTFINVHDLAEAVQAALASREGWVTVPREPTREMLAAGLDPLFDYLNDATDTLKTEDLVANLYAALLSAAPALPEGEG